VQVTFFFLEGLAFFHSWLAQGETSFPVHVIRMELDLYCLPDNAFHAFGSCGQDPGVLNLDSDPNLCCAWPHLICQDDIACVTVLLLDPGLTEMPGLTNADPTTFAGDAVDARCFQAKIILDAPKENRDPPMQEVPHSDFDFPEPAPLQKQCI
jgi:hypothetical protein